MYRVLNSIFDYSNNWDKKNCIRKLVFEYYGKSSVNELLQKEILIKKCLEYQMRPYGFGFF